MKTIETKSGLGLSQMALGCMNMPVDDEKKAEEIIEYALSQNINYFDTADLYQYGQNEKVIGDILKKYESRFNFYIGTKVGNEFDKVLKKKLAWNPKKTYIKAQVKESLHRLKIDSIDLYQLHGGTKEDDKAETVAAFEELKSEGVIRSYGISSIRPNVIDYYSKNSNMETLMLQLNPLDNRPEGIVDSLDNITILARGPLMQGLFTDKYESVVKRKFSNGLFGYSSGDLISKMKELQQHYEDLSTLSYMYIMSKNAVIISGVSSLDQLADNIESYRKALKSDERELVKTKAILKQKEYEEHTI